MSNTISRISFGTFLLKDKVAITLPKEVCLALHLEDEGAVFEMILENGRVILEPKTLIPKGEEWFWTEEWQAAEREVNEDIKAGRLSPAFDNVDEALKYLHDEVKRLEDNI